MVTAIPILEGMETKEGSVFYNYVMGIADQRGNIYILDFVQNK